MKKILKNFPPKKEGGDYRSSSNAQVLSSSASDESTIAGAAGAAVRCEQQISVNSFLQDGRIVFVVGRRDLHPVNLLARGCGLMTFSRQILAGLALGILTGLFFGERAAALKWAADGFVKLLQMMVLPYITVSIIASLGSLQPSELRTLGLRAAAVIGGLWLAGARVRLPDPADVSLGAERVVLQLEPRRAAARLRLHRPVHSREPVQLPGEQRRAGRGAVLPHSGRRRWSASRAGSACSTSCRSPETRSRRPRAS